MDVGDFGGAVDFGQFLVWIRKCFIGGSHGGGGGGERRLGLCFVCLELLKERLAMMCNVF